MSSQASSDADRPGPNPSQGDFDSNPFSTRFIRPDQLPYLDLPENTPSEVWARIRQAGFVGQIVGPHGAGKTAMLHQIVDLMNTDGINSAWQTIRPGMRVIPAGLSRETVTCLEGAELLPKWNLWRILWRVRRGSRVIFTTHHALTKVPIVATLQPGLDVAQLIVKRLLVGREWVINEDDVQATYEKHGGNLREMLLDLYDVYERRGHTKQ
jgi:hypothetical protein